MLSYWEYAQKSLGKFVQHFISNLLNIFIEYVIIYSMNKITGTAEPGPSGRESEKVMKYNKSKILKRAWELRRQIATELNVKVTEISMGECMKIAWADAKTTTIKRTVKDVLAEFAKVNGYKVAYIYATETEYPGRLITSTESDYHTLKSKGYVTLDKTVALELGIASLTNNRVVGLDGTVRRYEEKNNQLVAYYHDEKHGDMNANESEYLKVQAVAFYRYEEHKTVKYREYKQELEGQGYETIYGTYDKANKSIEVYKRELALVIENINLVIDIDDAEKLEMFTQGLEKRGFKRA